MNPSNDDLEKLEYFARRKFRWEAGYSQQRSCGVKVRLEHLLKTFKKFDAELESFSPPGLTKLEKEEFILEAYKRGLEFNRKHVQDSHFLSNCYCCKNHYDKNEHLQKQSKELVVPDFWCKPKNKRLDELAAEEVVTGFCLEYEFNTGDQAAEYLSKGHLEEEEQKLKFGEQIVAEQEEKYRKLLAEREKQKNKLKFRM